MPEIADAFLSNVLDNLPVGITIISPEGNFLYVNKSLCFYTGRSQQYYLSHSVSDMLSDGFVDEAIFSEVIRTCKPVSRLHRVTRGDGSNIRLLVTQTPYFDAEGNVEYIVAFQRDIDNEVRMYLENRVLSKDLDRSLLKAERPELIYQSEPMCALLDSLDMVIPTNVPILIQGETGTGKEVLARYIHANSKLANQPLISINCAALPEALLESELFGYEKGAFTGAASSGKKGIFEEADGGTLFLDEINSLPLSLQPKLLRILETSIVQRLGATKGKHISFRLIVATNASLSECVANGSFRLDLFYRINAMTATIPPLRERKADIIPLVNHYLEAFCRQYRCEKHFSDKAYQEFVDYSWPGNVRELRNAVERLVLTSNPSSTVIDSFAPALDMSDSLFPVPSAPVSISAVQDVRPSGDILSFWDERCTLSENLEIFERAILQEAFARYGTTTKIAEKTGVNQSTISRKLVKYGISRK